MRGVTSELLIRKSIQRSGGTIRNGTYDRTKKGFKLRTTESEWER